MHECLTGGRRPETSHIYMARVQIPSCKARLSSQLALDIGLHTTLSDCCLRRIDPMHHSLTEGIMGARLLKADQCVTLTHLRNACKSGSMPKSLGWDRLVGVWGSDIGGVFGGASTSEEKESGPVGLNVFSTTAGQ